MSQSSNAIVPQTGPDKAGPYPPTTDPAPMDALKADVARNLERTRALGRERGWPTS